MEPELPFSPPLATSAPSLNGTAPPTTGKKPGRGGGKPFASRPDLSAVKREILLRGAQKTKFTTAQARRWVSALKLGKKSPGMEFVYKRLREMAADGLLERIGTDGKRRRTYRVVKSDTMTAGQVIAAAEARTMAFVRTPEQIEQDLCLLEAMGIDTKDARDRQVQLKRALETKAALEK